LTGNVELVQTVALQQYGVMKNILLKDLSTSPPKTQRKKDIKEKTKVIFEEIEALQKVLMAQRKYSLLVVMQGMDASGKDGAIKKVFQTITPSGIHVKSFKKPTDEEFAHDFVWRAHKHVPGKGMIQVFNRSYYEDVLIQRVHNWIDDKVAHSRFVHINNFEKLLNDCDTQILKFYLHIGKDKQLDKLNERLNVPEKYYKHNDNDFEERKHWDKYMAAYEDVFEHCGQTPWHIVPSDTNWYKEYVIAKTIRDTLVTLDLEYPVSNDN
jgi:PPK2 family polyphosphate:nucleotide phosphotransferase